MPFWGSDMDYANDSFYTRNLPHWHPLGAILFLIWRLHGSLPPIPRTARNGCATVASPHSSGKKFLLMDRALDRCATGQAWLKNPLVADSFTSLLRKGTEELQYFDLHAYVIMPNHIHLVIAPKILLRRITNGLKGSTSRAANAILKRTGKPFWQDESYDHWIRNEREFGRICHYVECNPVSAGLVSKPEDWPWSSAHRGTAIPGCAPTTSTSG